MEYSTEEERLEKGLCPKCETDLVKASHNGGHPDDKTSECPKCGWLEERRGLRLEGTMFCCDKKMEYYPEQPRLNLNVDEFSFYLCRYCGRQIQIIDQQLDEEELENLTENIKGYDEND